MTLLWLGLALLNTMAVNKIWPGVPLFPVTNYFGILLFMTTLWYALNWGAYPIAKKSGVIKFDCGRCRDFDYYQYSMDSISKFKRYPLGRPAV